jgi:exopolysaccharide biosynthesis polyprenyl glycosylphosphotransferase
LFARRLIERRRKSGRPLHRLLIIGPADEAEALTTEMGRVRGVFEVVGSVEPRWKRGQALPIGPVEQVEDIVEAARRSVIDTIAVVGAAALPRGFIRQLAWRLEGTGVDLMVAPDVTDIAGPRLHVRPVSGFPMLYLEEPQFSGFTRLLKSTMDRLIASVSLIGLSPLLLCLVVLIRLTSPGPALFRQARSGRGGSEFQVWKFRTMTVGAEARRAELAADNESDGGLFKLRDDPRVTPLGRRLRRLSLDELPQLFNVLRGDMSLVGPRPLPVADTEGVHEIRRRLLVKPGMTGLWQVSGRADLSWEETVRLDLYYVENWSLALDLVIMVRTVVTVIRGTGAY